MGEARYGELGEIRLPQEDRTGLFQISYDSGILVRDEVREEAGAARGADAPGPELVLHGHGDSVHGAQIVAASDGLLGLAGIPERLLTTYGEVGVELEVQVVYAVQVGLRSLHRRDLSLLYQS